MFTKDSCKIKWIFLIGKHNKAHNIYHNYSMIVYVSKIYPISKSIWNVTNEDQLKP